MYKSFGFFVVFVVLKTVLELMGLIVERELKNNGQSKVETNIINMKLRGKIEVN